MKKYALSFVYCLLFISFCVSCSQIHHSNNINITVSESGHQYKLLAYYPEENTARVGEYLNEKLGKRNNISFANSKIDAILTLDNGTKFYIKNLPGDLEIKFNKEENSMAAYKEIKTLGDGLKPLLQQ